MAKYGLAQIDLNLLAQLALTGGSDQPERDIAQLLRSDQPIERVTRLRLANALDQSSKNGIFLSISGVEPTGPSRSYLTLKRRIDLARKRETYRSRMSASDASKAVGDEAGLNEDSMKKAVTLLRRFNRWRDKIHASADEASRLPESTLEAVFLYAQLTKISPDDALKPSAPTLVKLMDLMVGYLMSAGSWKK